VPKRVEQNRIVEVFRFVPDFLLQLCMGLKCAVVTQRINQNRVRALGPGNQCIAAAVGKSLK
jgi:hypothetical protein